MRTRIAAVVMVLLALFQVGLLWGRVNRRPASSPPIFHTIGDTIGLIRARFEDGGRAWFQPKNREGRWTVVMAFRADCKPSRAVAPAWREWLAAHPGLNVVAVTRDSLAPAVAYRDSQRWPVRVFSLERPVRGSPEHRLVTRTPWVFLLDPTGVVRYEGQGGTLAALDSAIARNTAAGAPPRASDRL